MLRRKQIQGLQFYRQKPLLKYIVDFYCPKAQLVIELDGGQHFDEANQKQDQARTNDLTALGLTVIRFDNRQVLTETEAVLEAIVRQIRLYISSQIPDQIPPNPPLTKGGNTSRGGKIISFGNPNPPLTKGGNTSSETAETQKNQTPQRNAPPFEKGGQGGFATEKNSL